MTIGAASLRAGVLVALTATASACAGGGGLRLAPASPREQYADGLRRAGLDQTALGRDWAAAGVAALSNPVPVATPFEERGYFPPGEAVAVAYRLELARGRRLDVAVTHDSSAPGRLFVELFEQRPDGPRLVAAMDEGAASFTHEVGRDGAYLLRLQPELLRGGAFVVRQRTLAGIRTFPVQGLTSRAVQSGFGAARDAGAREHEGIDIFAPRGTPVVAVAGGTARPDTNGLGGQVVWLRDGWTGPTYYYAHLDRWAFESTRQVHAGDVLGYVGNTGNARTTAPHLHFGVYDDGAIDPLPFVAPDDAPPEAAPQDERLGALVRTRAARTPLRTAPMAGAPVARHLEAATVARVLGASTAALRVRLPDATTGYLAAGAAVPATRLRVQPLPAGARLLEGPDVTSPLVRVLETARSADVLGTFGSYALVRDADGRLGWWQPDNAQKPSGPGTTR